MITSTIQLRPRYGEVDRMGYVYHANHVNYCHQARTELLRKFGLHDDFLEQNNVMLPVISFDIQYKKPARYDELLNIKTTITEMPKIRFHFEFEITNQEGQLLSKAKSTVVFANWETRLPIVIPGFVKEKLQDYFIDVETHKN